MIHRTFISPDELYEGRRVRYQDVVGIAATLNRSEALHFVAFLNLLLSSATTETNLKGDLAPVRDVQTWVFREVVGDQLLSDLKAKFGAASLLDRPVLHRSQLLFAIRVVATHSQANGGNMLAVRRDFDAIGDLLFSISGLFGVDEIAAEGTAVALTVATHAGPLYELENPPAIELTLPRVQDLLINRLPATSADPADLERLEQIAVFTTGFGIQAWLDLSFMLFSFWSTATFRELMENRGRAYLDPRRPYEIVSAEILQRAVHGLSVDFEDLPNVLRIDAFSRSVLFDLTPFRTKPLWRMSDGLVLCVDAGLLTERLGPHAFWSVMNSLDTSERRHRFSGAWGDAFESYVLDVLASIFSAKKWSFRRNPWDDAADEELWDAVAARGDTVIVIEIKGTFIQTAAKYSGIPRIFARGLTEKFGIAPHAGAFQLTRGISRAWFDKTAVVSTLRLTEATDVFPVLIVQDPILGFGGVSRVLSDRFRTRLERLKRGVMHKTPKIWPLTVVTADELDRLSAAVEATHVRLDSVLKRFHRTFPSRARSISELLDSELGSDYGFPDRVREIIGRRFSEKMRGVLDRFRQGGYGRAVDIQEN